MQYEERPGARGAVLRSPAEEAAMDLMLSEAKDPSSVRFHNTEVIEEETVGSEEWFIVYVDCSGTNSFGGTVRNDYYVCLHFENGDRKNYMYNPRAWQWDADFSDSVLAYQREGMSFTKEDYLDVVKSMNGWPGK